MCSITSMTNRSSKAQAQKSATRPRQHNSCRFNNTLPVRKYKVGSTWPMARFCLLQYPVFLPSVLWHCWLGGMKGIRPVKNWAWCAGVVLSLERCADLHMAQLMPLPLTVSCFSIIRIGFTFLTPAHLGSPGQRAVKRVCVRAVSSVRLLQLLQFAMLRRTVYGNSKGFEVKVGMHRGSARCYSWLLFLIFQDQGEDQRRPGKRLYVSTVKHVSWIKRMPWTVANGERW